MALLTALMALLMMLALGAGVAVTALTETAIAANHRDGIQTLYAAEAAAALAVHQLRAVADWQTVVNGGTAIPLLSAPLAALLQSGTVNPRIVVLVTVAPDPAGDASMLVMQSSAMVPGGLRRTVQVTLRRRPAAGDIEILSWR